MTSLFSLKSNEFLRREDGRQERRHTKDDDRMRTEAELGGEAATS